MNDQYQLISTKILDEYRSETFLLRHKKSGALIYALQNSDEENLFTFGFRTPSRNDRGTAHILEHTVLCGSKNFPIKDPFLSMMKGSMQTFLNAMTYPDKTLYPAASTLEKDYFNLMNVYGDAVFFPLLRQEAFDQEAHRLQFNADEDRLERVGIVYNEMKGAYSSLENFAYDWSVKSLYPTNSYRYDSGGDPSSIPELSYDEFQQFHTDYYHPSNAKIFLYGNISLDKKLAFLDSHFLQHFDDRVVSSVVVDEQPFEKPIYLIKSFASNNINEKLATVSINWLLGEVSNTEELLALNALSHILLGSDGAPFYMALQNSHLGEDVSPISGLGSDYKRAIFSAAIREVAPENEEMVRPLVLKTLEDIINKGITHEEIEAALRTIELNSREIKSGPFGIRLMGKLYKSWNYDTDPDRIMPFNDPMDNLRLKAFGDQFFEKMIRGYLIENKHQSCVTVKPDHQLYIERQRQEDAQLLNIYQSLGEQGKKQIKERMDALKAYQQSIDLEGVAPKLSRLDAPSTIQVISYQCDRLKGRPMISHHSFSNGLFYWRMAFDLSVLDESDFKWLPFFAHCMGSVGFDDLDYDTVSRLNSLYIGDLSFGLDSGATWHAKDGTLGKNSYYLIVSIKCIKSQLNEAPLLVARNLADANFSNDGRLKDLFLELYNDFKGSVVPSGSSFASLYLASHQSISAYIENLWHGIDQLLFLEEQKTKIDSSSFWSSVEQKFNYFKAMIFNVEQATFNYASEEKEQILAIEALKVMSNKLHTTRPSKSGKSLEVVFKKYEATGFTTGSQVNYVAVLLQGAAYATKERAALQILSHHLNAGPLWETIRMKGGAYGASSSNGGLESYFTLSSYRDPHIQKTLEAFRTVLINFTTMSQEQLDEALIAVIGKEMRPLSPSDRSNLALRRYLYAIDDQSRQKGRDYLFMLTPDDIIAAARGLVESIAKALVAVVGASSAIVEAQKQGLVSKVIKLP